MRIENNPHSFFCLGFRVGGAEEGRGMWNVLGCDGRKRKRQLTYLT